MSLRMIARDLYRLKKEVEALERRLLACDESQRQELDKQLTKARAERDRLQAMLDGAKEPPPYRLPR
jgi:GAF domain-containing protein